MGLRQTLLDALEHDNPEIFVRVLAGYVKDDAWWVAASDAEVDLITSLCDIIEQGLQNAKYPKSKRI